MENTSRMTDELKHFYHMRKENHNSDRSQIPEITIDITIKEDEEDTPADILYQAADVLTDCAEMVSKAAFLVSLMQDRPDDGDAEPAEDACDDCPFGCRCGSEYGPMVLVARPGGDNTILTIEELADEDNGIFAGRTGTYDMKPVPGAKGLYYTIPEKKPLQRGGKIFYKAPAVVFGIDENEREVVNPGAKQLFTAMRFFEDASRTIKTREGGEYAVFCFD